VITVPLPVEAPDPKAGGRRVPLLAALAPAVELGVFFLPGAEGSLELPEALGTPSLVVLVQQARIEA
jgi:hypothetical protein